MSRQPHERTENNYNLGRFVAAQEATYSNAVRELRSGKKRSHWMWFIFPQLEGLGTSSMAARYAITASDEAHAYLAHPLLGPRLIECAEAVLAVQNRSASEILGSPDDLKLRSSATLFAHISPPGSVFHQILEQYYDNRSDPLTIALLRREPQ